MGQQYRHLGFDERIEVEKRLEKGWSYRRIGRWLGRAVRSHQPRLFTRDKIVAYVCDRLRCGWSPAQIAGRGTQDGVRISHESIYAWIYANEQRAKDWSCYLVRGHKHLRRKLGLHVHRSRIPFRVSIHHRPPVIDERVEFGH